MALQYTLKNIKQVLNTRYFLAAKRHSHVDSRLTNRDCSGSTPAPACPPCEPKPRPCCRRKVSPGQFEMQVLCRPPPAGRRPPCPPRPHACPLTCNNYNTQQTSQMSSKASDPCGQGGPQDRVTARLTAAKEQRRRDYFSNLKKRTEKLKSSKNKSKETCPPVKPESTPTPPSLQVPVGEGVFAADGHSYHRDPPPPPRDVPAPHLVPRCLTSGGLCHPDNSKYLDPCQNRPPMRLTVLRDVANIDQSSSTDTVSSPTSPAPVGTDDLRECCPKACIETGSKQNLSERLKNRLNLNKKSKQENKQAVCSTKSSSVSGMKAGDTTWCSRPPETSTDAPPCKEASFADKLKRRASAPPACTPAPCRPPQRSFHTNVTRFVSQCYVDSSHRYMNKDKQECFLRKTNVFKEIYRGYSSSNNREHSFTGSVDIRLIPCEDSRTRLSMELSFRNDLFTLNSGNEHPNMISSKNKLIQEHANKQQNISNKIEEICKCSSKNEIRKNACGSKKKPSPKQTIKINSCFNQSEILNTKKNSLKDYCKKNSNIIHEKCKTKSKGTTVDPLGKRSANLSSQLSCNIPPKVKHCTKSSTVTKSSCGNETNKMNQHDDSSTLKKCSDILNTIFPSTTEEKHSNNLNNKSKCNNSEKGASNSKINFKAK